MTPNLGPVGELGPAAVLRAVGVVREGLVVDLSLPLDADLLPEADERFSQRLARRDLMTPDEFSAATLPTGPAGEARGGR